MTMTIQQQDDEPRKLAEETGVGTDNEPIEPPLKKETKSERTCRRLGINPSLVTLKVTLFVFYGATSSLLPYLTIHMQSIGLTVEEIAIIYLALPFTTFLAPPITGFLVDKFGRYKPVVIMSLLLNALFHHSLLFIPQQEIPGKMPDAYVMRHPGTGSVEVWWSPCPSRECPDEEELNIIVDQCLDHCLLLEQDPKIEIVQPPTLEPIHKMQDIEHDNLNFQLSKKKASKENASSYVTTTDSFLDMTTRARSSNRTSALNLTEESEEEEESWVADSEESAFFRLDMHPDLGDPIEQLGIEIEQDDNVTVTDFKTRFGEKFLWKQGVNVTELEEEDLRCGGLVLKSNMSLTYESRLIEYAKDCMVQKCKFRQGGPEICPPDYIESDDTVFWTYFVLRFMATTMLSAAVTIMDPIVLQMVEKYGGDFGRERLSSSLGMAIFSPITGFLIDYSSRGLGYTNYSAAFYTFDILLVISALAVLTMPLGEKLPADNVFKDLITLLALPHVMAFIIFMFILGNFWGFIESFLFLYLKELGAPNYLLGITITVGTMSSVPFLYGAEKITKVFGHVNLIVIAFVAHAGRLVGYSLIENAWWCFPFEAMEALSCHLMWVAAATYCAYLAPKTLLATLIGVLGMAHFSLGRGSGSFVGGFMIGEVGTRESFRYMGCAAVISGILYKSLHYFWLKKFDNTTEEELDDAVESGETEKLTKPGMVDTGTSMSQERLFLMVKFNQIGSLASLRSSKADISDGRGRRSSYQIEYVKGPSKAGGSASKVDLLKSALEINHKTSQPMMLRPKEKSIESISQRMRADSAPKLSNPNLKHISHPVLSSVVDEVNEPSQLSRLRKRHHQSGILPPLDSDCDLLHNYLRETNPETIPEGVTIEVNKKSLPAVNMDIPKIIEKNENCVCECSCSQKKEEEGEEAEKKPET